MRFTTNVAIVFFLCILAATLLIDGFTGYRDLSASIHANDSFFLQLILLYKLKLYLEKLTVANLR